MRRISSYPQTVALLLVATSIAPLSSQVQAEPAGQLTQPIHRVANEEPVTATPKLAARIAVAADPQAPFDLTEQPGQHPLIPALQMAKEILGNLDTNIPGYSAVLRKQERVEGVLLDEEIAYVKVRHNPFSVYMYFLSPCKGRECLYNELPDGSKGKLVARDCGWKRRLGAIELDPEGRLAMGGQKYPIMKIGIRGLTTELIDVATNDVNFGECEVKTFQTVMNKRPVTQIVVTHPTERRNFRFHKAELFIDNELRIPTRYAAYKWPAKPGDPAPLEEMYTYLNVKVIDSFPANAFAKGNPAIFKK